jgi:threonine dehydrogenase-like Zn-dependent dehydrogenase
MRAMVFTRPSVVELLDVDEPVPGEGEVIVEVRAAGICGSELHGIVHPGFRRPPLVMGHEFVGLLPDGRRVAVNPIVNCGTCDLCAMGEPQLCRQRALIGIHRPGAFAPRVAVPERLVVELPEQLPWNAAALIEPIANAVHVWRLAGSPTGTRVGIIGAGTIGLACLLVAAHHGNELDIADLSEQRLAHATELGAVRTGAALDGEYGVVIDAVGAPATRAASIDRVRPGGTAVWIGLLDEAPGFDALHLVRFEKRISGSFAYRQDDFAAAVALAAELDLGWTTSFTLEDGPTIFTELMNGRTDVVKAVLHPQGADI